MNGSLVDSQHNYITVGIHWSPTGFGMWLHNKGVKYRHKAYGLNIGIQIRQITDRPQKVR